MPVFYRDALRVLYVHVPKTGGRSLEQFFIANKFQIEYYDEGKAEPLLNRVRLCSPQHMHAEALCSIFHIKKFDYVFMTVRNPFSRLISEYKMQRSLRKDVADFNSWVAHYFKVFHKNPYALDNHIRPQAEFLVPGCDVHRIESGYDAKWVAALSQKLSVTFDRTTVGRNARRFHAEVAPMTDQTVAAIQKFYRRDFLLFGYRDVDFT